MEEDLNKVTYLIGAGASANALPMIKPTANHPGYLDSLKQLSKELFSIERKVNLSDCREFAKELEWLADKAGQHGSPDTFVKYLTLKRDEHNVAKVKRILSLYFTIEQFINKKIDHRYLKFLTKVIGRHGIFPTNIKILNWNYDFQFQIAAEEFQQESLTYINTVTKHSPPLIPYYPTLGREFNINQDSNNLYLSLVHLNGIAGFYYSQDTSFVLSYFMNSSLASLDDVFQKYTTDRHLKATLLTFAFDAQDHMNTSIRNRFDYADTMIRETDYVVIIGYSFPNDNIEIDEKLFKTLHSPSLKEIFYQDPYSNGGFLRDLFEINEKVKITHIEDVSEFYIPRQHRLKKKSTNSGQL